MVRVLCTGHVNWDVTLRVDALPDTDGEATIDARTVGGGGSAAKVAVGLCDLEIPTGLLGSVGDDLHGRQIREDLADRGVELTHLRTVTGSTAVKYLIVDADGEVMVLGSDGVNEAVGPETLPDGVLEGVEHVHLTGQRPDTAAALVSRATATGVTHSVDPGRGLDRRNYAPVIAAADVVFVNEREA